MPGILHGLRVVEGSAFVAAPLGGMTLAQLGADVIRFDPIGGGLDHHRWPVTAEGRSLFWAGMNKGKRSIAVDLRKPRGQELLTQLIAAPGADAGLFSTNFPARGWLAYEALSRARADLVMVNLLGRRDGGSEVDYTVNPQFGFPMLTGAPDGPPANHVFPAWDAIAGNMIATAMLAALRHRDRTGEGQLVTLALKDVGLALLGHLGMIGEVQVNGVDRPRYGNHLYGAFGRDFVTQDGRRLMVVGLTDMQWSCLLKATGLAAEIDALAARLQVDLALAPLRRGAGGLRGPSRHLGPIPQRAAGARGGSRSLRGASDVRDPRPARHRAHARTALAARFQPRAAPARAARAAPRRTHRRDPARGARPQRRRGRRAARCRRRRRSRRTIDTTRTHMRRRRSPA
jgi:crotonobetainyl-CoA:carnitine CoA-transferase CaiB-like acyl-CoA transferase